VKNSLDDSIKSINDVKLGMFVKGKIVSVKSTQINIKLADNLRGRIHASQVFDSFDAVIDQRNPLGSFKSGQEIIGCVIGFHCAKTHNYLPFGHANNPANTVIDLSIKPSVLDHSVIVKEETKNDCLEALQIGQKIFGFVQKIEQEAIWIQIGSFILGRSSSIFEISKDLSILDDLHAHFSEGQAIECHIIALNKEKHIVDLSLIGNEEKYTFENLKIGTVLNGKFTAFNPAQGATVKISANLHGRVHLTDIHEVLKTDLAEYAPIGKFVKVVVVDVDIANRKIALSMKETDMQTSTPQKNVVSIGDVVSGYVKSISEKGCFVEFSRTKYARVKISDLSDDYLTDWKSMFTTGKFVVGKIIR
jgi:rRNA biogenesis protein RRP5